MGGETLIKMLKRSMGIKIMASTLLVLLLTGCVGRMLQGRMYAMPTGRQLEFSIQTSYGSGKMTARDPKTGEKFSGEYSAFYKGQESIHGNVGGVGVSLNKRPTGANASGILVGESGTVIRIYFEIKPGIRPTGHGKGEDQAGNEYDVYF